MFLAFMFVAVAVLLVVAAVRDSTVLAVVGWVLAMVWAVLVLELIVARDS